MARAIVPKTPREFVLESWPHVHILKFSFFLIRHHGENHQAGPIFTDCNQLIQGRLFGHRLPGEQPAAGYLPTPVSYGGVGRIGLHGCRGLQPMDAARHGTGIRRATCECCTIIRKRSAGFRFQRPTCELMDVFPIRKIRRWSRWR